MKDSKPSKCYAASEALVKVLSDIHNFEVRKARLEEKINAAGASKDKKQLKILEEDRKTLKKDKRLLDRRKVDTLNKYIFPSMANLTQFLEYMLVSPHVGRVFERDLKALFFAKSEVSQNKEPVFARFIDACCWSMTVPKEGGTRTPLPDFRIILMEIMMDKIWMMMRGIAEYKFRDVEFLNNVLYVDFNRAASWMKEFAHEPHGHLDFDEKRRPALF